jgi:hypothetical protein
MFLYLQLFVAGVDDFKLKVKVRSIRLSISSIQLPYDHDHDGPNAQLGFSNVYDVTIIYLDQTLIILDITLLTQLLVALHVVSK